MSSLMLTDEERNRFAAWLEREAETGQGIVEQREKQNIAAAIIIARKLRNTHSETIG